MICLSQIKTNFMVKNHFFASFLFLFLHIKGIVFCILLIAYGSFFVSMINKK